jgi:hypothetical protein
MENLLSLTKSKGNLAIALKQRDDGVERTDNAWFVQLHFLT